MKKVVLITGSSRGIGASTAILLAKAGFQVCINYMSNHDAAQSLVKKITDEGGFAKCVQGDVSKESDVNKIFQFVKENFGRLDALVNNAGILATYSRFENMDNERIQRLFGVNVFGAMMCARKAIPMMSTQNGFAGGVIVNVSTAFVKTGAPNMAIDYASTKGAVEIFSIGLAKELALDGIRVNVVRPGMIDTEIHADGGDPDRASKAKDFVPMKRVGKAEEVANAIKWLLSEESSYSTGAILDVSGGV
jgi:NAD(P)-dependent dehydrogenase (short-subunit alcohol dehydrogenase family)